MTVQPQEDPINIDAAINSACGSAVLRCNVVMVVVTAVAAEATPTWNVVSLSAAREHVNSTLRVQWIK